MSGSEIARILQQIREEEEAAQRVLADYAVVGLHAFMNARTENIGRYTRTLVDLVGSEQAAMALIIADQESVAGDAKHVSLC